MSSDDMTASRDKDRLAALAVSAAPELLAALEQAVQLLENIDGRRLSNGVILTYRISPGFAPQSPKRGARHDLGRARIRPHPRPRAARQRQVAPAGVVVEAAMIFEPLYESAQRGELLLIDGGYCRWHMRRDMSITIYEIISTRPGAGSEMLAALKRQGAWSIVAKCPIKLLANEWYARRGFQLEATERTKSGRELNVWRLSLSSV